MTPGRLNLACPHCGETATAFVREGSVDELQRDATGSSEVGEREIRLRCNRGHVWSMEDQDAALADWVLGDPPRPNETFSDVVGQKVWAQRPPGDYVVIIDTDGHGMTTSIAMLRDDPRLVVDVLLEKLRAWAQ